MRKVALKMHEIFRTDSGLNPELQIQCILDGKWQNPDYTLRIAVKRLIGLK